MKNVIKKTKLSKADNKKFSAIMRTWQPFIFWLRKQEDEKVVLKCFLYEVRNECRPAFADRLRTKYNSLRTRRELEEIESEIGKIISLNSRK